MSLLLAYLIVSCKQELFSLIPLPYQVAVLTGFLICLDSKDETETS